MLARTRWFNKTIAYLTLLSCRDRRPGWFGGLASLSADAPAGGTAGVSSHANTIHHVHTGAACFADCRDHAARFWMGAIGTACADDARAKAKATAINLSIASSLLLDVLARPAARLRGAVGAKDCTSFLAVPGLSAGTLERGVALRASVRSTQ